MPNGRKFIGAAAVAIILAANGWVVWSYFGGASAAHARREERYFSTDDGATYFADDAAKLPPFDHDGKPAVEAHVFAAGGKQWVAYLERYTTRGRQLMEAVEKHEIGPEKLRGIVLKEVKKPGEPRWVSPADGLAYVRVITAKSPGGGNDEPRPVTPTD